ncbi:unnamed protein product [Lymnaea stagnalis]|uniref:Uncharacterized protein n=1 Tax=Lymnaea stagnalis TaxID=6523 RepID=A0AAV2H0G9_LYMST
MTSATDVFPSLLCYEAVSFLIYGTLAFLIILYTPYWIRQQLDKYFLQTLAMRANQRTMQKQMDSFKNRLSMGETVERFDDTSYEKDGEDTKAGDLEVEMFTRKEYTSD